MWLLIPFLVLPVIEIAVFIQVGGLIGLWPTIGLVILSAVLGSWLMRRQGAAALADLQRSFRELRDPTAPLAHGALILLAGALMVTPGFVTDTMGLLLLVPAVRRWVMGQLRRRMHMTSAGFVHGSAGPANWPRGRSRPGPARGPRIIDADYVVVEDEPGPDGGQPPSPGRTPGPPSGWTRH